MKDRSATISLTLRWTSCILGLLSIFLVAIIYTQSNGFFHPTDILDIWLWVATIIGSIILHPECHLFLAFYDLVYVFVIKGMLQVFFDSKRIMEMSRDNPKYLVVLRTLSGKVYRGRPEEFIYSLVLELGGVEKRVGKNDWKKSENEDFFWFNIIWITRVPNKQIELQIV